MLCISKNRLLHYLRQYQNSNTAKDQLLLSIKHNLVPNNLLHKYKHNYYLSHFQLQYQHLHMVIHQVHKDKKLSRCSLHLSTQFNKNMNMLDFIQLLHHYCMNCHQLQLYK